MRRTVEGSVACGAVMYVWVCRWGMRQRWRLQPFPTPKTFPGGGPGQRGAKSAIVIPSSGVDWRRLRRRGKAPLSVGLPVLAALKDTFHDDAALDFNMFKTNILVEGISAQTAHADEQIPLATASP